jgi:hypothetical protein
MAAYCQEVHRLGDKFDGLELNHIPGWFNEVADTMAKMVSSHQPILSGIFASNQYKPLVRYEEFEWARDKPPASASGARQPPTLSNLEVMELDMESATVPDPPAE